MDGEDGCMCRQDGADGAWGSDNGREAQRAVGAVEAIHLRRKGAWLEEAV